MRPGHGPGTRTRSRIRALSGVGRPASLLLARHTRRYQFVGQLTDDWPCGLPKSEPEALERLQRSELRTLNSRSVPAFSLSQSSLLFVSSSHRIAVVVGGSPCSLSRPPNAHRKIFGLFKKRNYVYS